jgi:AsmA protein
MRRFFVGLSISLFALILLAWASLAFFHNSLRLRAESAIDQLVTAQVSFSEMSITLLRHFPNVTVTLYDLNIVGTDEFATDTLARSKELDLEIKTSSLFYGNAVELKSLHLKSPHLYFKIAPDGDNNYTIFHSDSLKTKHAFVDSSYVNIALDEVKVSDAKIEFEDLSTGTYVLLRGVNHSGSGELKNDLLDLTTKTTIEEFNLDYGKVKLFSRKEAEIDLVMQMNVKNNSFTLKENKIRVNHFVLALEGSFGLLENGYDLDLSFNTQATDFKNIISLIPGIFMEDFKKITTAGQLSLNGFVSGQYIPESGQLPSLLADIKIADAMFKIDTLPDPVENIRLELAISNFYGHRDSTVFDLKNFQFDMRKHVVQGRIKIQGLDHFRVDTDVKADIDLAELEKMYPISGIELKGKANFELAAKGALRFNKKNYLEQIPPFHLTLQLADGKIKYDSLPASLDSIQFHLVADNKTGRLENSVFDFKAIHVTFDKNRVHGFMKLEGYNDLKIKTDLKANLDLADIEKMFPIDSTVMRGNLFVDVEAEGIYSHDKKKFPSIDAKVELVDGYLKTPGYHEPLESIHWSGEVINTTGNFSDTRLAINRLTYTLEGEPFLIRGTVSDLNTYNYDLQIRGRVDLEKLTAIYPVNGIKLKGIIHSNIKSQGKLSDIEAGHYERVISEGKLRVTNFMMETASIPAPLIIQDAEFNFTPSKIQLKNLTGKFGRSNISLSGDLYNYMSFVTRTDDLVKCDLILKADTLDMNEWLSEKSVASKTPSNKIYVWKVPLMLEAVFDSEIAYVLYEDMKISKLDGEIRMKDGVMHLHETGFNTLNAEFDISGDYDTRDMTHPRFDVDLDIKELDIQKAYKEMKIVRELLPAAGDAEGIFSIDYKIKGELTSEFYPKTETLIGAGAIRISNAKINGMKIFEELSKASKKNEVNDPHLKDFVMKSEIRDNKIIVKPFSIKVSGIEADVEGVSEINGVIRYVVKMELPPLGIKIPFHVTGSYSNPKVAMGKGHVLMSSDSLPD